MERRCFLLEHGRVFSINQRINSTYLDWIVYTARRLQVGVSPTARASLWSDR